MRVPQPSVAADLCCLSRSTGRKVLATAAAAVAFAFAVRGHHPRFPLRRAAGRSCASPPPARPRRAAAVHGHRLLQGHHDRVGGERADGHRRRRPRRCCRSARSSRSTGWATATTASTRSWTPARRSRAATRPLHVELQRGAGARPARRRHHRPPARLESAGQHAAADRPAVPAARSDGSGDAGLATRTADSPGRSSARARLARQPRPPSAQSATPGVAEARVARYRSASPAPQRSRPSPGPCTAAGTACSRSRAAPAAPGGCRTRAACPWCSTRILSMSWIVDSRCAMAIVVRPAISTCSASRISSSVSVSTLDVASSRIEDRAGRTPAPGRTTAAASARPTASRRARRPGSS